MEKPITEIMDLSGKVALVTGAAGGIGLGIVKRLLEAGAQVAMADHNQQLLQESIAALAPRYDGNVFGISGDVSHPGDVANIIDGTITKFGTVDILVNNAGIYPNIPVMQMSVEDFDRVIATNLRSVYLCTRLVANHLITNQKPGKIINITSIDALHPSGIGLAHYDASKHGMWGFTKNVALELASHEITVNAVAPGGVETPGVTAHADKKVLDAFSAKIPMGRLGQPDDIAKVVLFLASDLSGYMTGSQIVVDGGALLT